MKTSKSKKHNSKMKTKLKTMGNKRKKINEGTNRKQYLRNPKRKSEKKNSLKSDKRPIIQSSK